MVSYTALTWAHQTETLSVIDRMQTLNKTAMNTMVKVPRSTPTQGMELILHITPLHLHVPKEGLATYIRFSPSPPIQWEGVFTNLTNAVSHLWHWEHQAKDAQLQTDQSNTDVCNVLCPTPNFVLDTSSFVDMENCQSPLECNVYMYRTKLNGKLGGETFSHVKAFQIPFEKNSVSRTRSRTGSYQRSCLFLLENDWPDNPQILFRLPGCSSYPTIQLPHFQARTSNIPTAQCHFCPALCVGMDKGTHRHGQPQRARPAGKRGYHLCTLLWHPTPQVVVKNTIK